MNVGELKKLLAGVPDDAKVEVSDGDSEMVVKSVYSYHADGVQYLTLCEATEPDGAPWHHDYKALYTDLSPD